MGLTDKHEYLFNFLNQVLSYFAVLYYIRERYFLLFFFTAIYILV